MKLKKYSYLIALIVMLLIGINGVKADVNKTCYYLESTKQAQIILEINSNGKTTSYIQKLGKKLDNDTESVLNWYKEFSDDETGMTLNKINSSKSAAKKTTTCPTYLMVRTNNSYSSYGLFASNSETIASQFVAKSNATGEFKTWYLTYKNADGSEITSKQYYETFVTIPEGVYNPNVVLECDDLFGSKTDENSIAYMIDYILQYVRIIVPIIIIVLGTLDLAKAVISSKEEEMRKAQATFIKRLLLGIVVFLVPVIVNVIMDLADIVWESTGYSSCEFVIK